MKHISIQYHPSKIGEMIIGSFNNQLCLLDFRYRKMRATVNKRIQQTLNADFIEQNNTLLSQAKTQFDEYLKGERQAFTLPLLTAGTEFQKSVWQALQKIPYGATATYAQLAQSIHNEKTVRAVAGANGANAIAIIIPCHRIIESNGGLGGYAGGIKAKNFLLTLEKGNTPSLPLF